jgi:hypothetical protein
MRMSLSTYVVVDEAMKPFRGRTLHKTKVKDKPVKEGYKQWVLACAGYVIAFIFHSGSDGNEECAKVRLVNITLGKEHVSPTKLVVITLIE